MTQIVRQETVCRRHMGYSIRLAAMVLIYIYMHHPTDRITPIPRPLCRGALAGTIE